MMAQTGPNPFLFNFGRVLFNIAHPNINSGDEQTTLASEITSALPLTKAHDVEIMARTIYGEARGEGVAGMQAVANVIINRYKEARRKTTLALRWGITIAGVCKKKAQFSCWNPENGLSKNDVNIMNNYKLMTHVTRSDSLYNTAYNIALRAVNGTLADNTNGATYYHTTSVKPTWAVNKTPVALVASHKFYTTSQIG